MSVDIFSSIWTHQGSQDHALAFAQSSGFEGIEGPVPDARDARSAFLNSLKESDLLMVAEICTATEEGHYVPIPGASVREHLDSLEARLENALLANPLFITTMAGSDAWSYRDVIAFHTGVLELMDRYDIIISVETHRTRCLFHPWVTRDVLQELPDLRITCDFSHWCVVAERLVLNDEPDILRLMARHAHHFHARIGYAQGPQVPDPRAPEYQEAREAHESWWQSIRKVQKSEGCDHWTLTPEAGPDGYLQTIPFTEEPLANLNEINQWMGKRQKPLWQ